MRKYPGETERGRYNKVWLTDSQYAWFKETYPVTENKRVARAMGVSKFTVHRIAREYGLKKSEEGMRAIKKRKVKAIRRKCEASGYYESLRVHKPSEAAYEGLRRYLNSDTYRHPYTVLKEEHPRKYRQVCKRKSESKKRLIEEERKRIRLGLRRKTRLHLPVNKWTTSQLQRRYNALKHGYIIPDGQDYENRWCVWYDEDTQRGEIFERNLLKDGFKVLPLPDEDEEDQSKRAESWTRYNQSITIDHYEKEDHSR